MPFFEETRFKPAWWLNSPHLQTLWPALLRRLPALPTVRERLATPDGDFIDLDWYGGESPAPLVLLLHGLAGSAQSFYIQGMQAALARRGWRSAALNFRGCSGEPNRTARCYHSGDTGDLDFLYRHLRQRAPQVPLAAVGFSLGGNVLLKWLGERGGAADLLGAAAVSAPMQLNHCADRLDHGFSRFYRNHLLRELKAYIQRKRDYLRRFGPPGEREKLDRLGDLSGIRSFWEYDGRVVARLYGFRDAEDYYRQSSSRQYLQSIRIPTLIVQARDDPFTTPEILPGEDELSSHVRLEITAGGGHVGFVAGSPTRPRYWLEQRIPGFFQECFSAWG